MVPWQSRKWRVNLEVVAQGIYICKSDLLDILPVLISLCIEDEEVCTSFVVQQSTS